MNRKGQLGKLISIIPIMFLIFIIMAIFLLLAGGGSITYAKSVFHTEAVSQGNLMERDIVLPGGAMTIREALLDFADNYYEEDRETRFSALGEGLKNFLDIDGGATETKADMCLIILAQVGGRDKLLRPITFIGDHGDDSTFSFYFYRFGSDGQISSAEGSAYTDAYTGSTMPFNLLTKDNNLLDGMYYYGKCL